MRNIFATIFVAFCSYSHAAEPIMDWTVIAFDAQGNKTTSYKHSSHGMTSGQIQTLCNRAMSRNLPFAPTESVKVIVRPSPDDKRYRSAELTCAEVRQNQNALSNYLKPPQPPKPKTRTDIINLWD